MLCARGNGKTSAQQQWLAAVNDEEGRRLVKAIVDKKAAKCEREQGEINGASTDWRRKARRCRVGSHH